MEGRRVGLSLSLCHSVHGPRVEATIQAWEWVTQQGRGQATQSFGAYRTHSTIYSVQKRKTSASLEAGVVYSDRT